MAFTHLGPFISHLRDHKEIVEIHAEVKSDLELAEIHRRIAAADGPALLFRNVQGSPFPVATNLFGSNKRISLAFHNQPEKFVANLVKLATRDFPPSLKTLWGQRSQLKKLFNIGLKRRKIAPVMQHKATGLEQLPILKCWPMDGGHFLTLPLVYTESPRAEGAPNLGVYRMQRYDNVSCGMHWQIGKGGGFHYHLAEQENKPLPVNVFLGGPPALIVSAIAPLPENVPEMLLCSILQGSKLDIAHSSHNSYPVVAEAEFALIGEVAPQVRRMEGPFGDHYGYYSLEHEFPVFRCQHLYHRKDAIYPATVVGKPRQEDFYLGDFLQALLSPLFPVVMPGVKDLWSYGETGFHSLAAAVVRERYYRECMNSAFRILGEGQLALTKFLLVTDQSVDLRDFKGLLTTVLERFRPETDLFVFSNLSMDTLDYTGPELNKGSRGIMLGVGEKIRDLPEGFQGKIPLGVAQAEAFSPGCLVVEANGEIDLMVLCAHEDFQKWPLIIVVDSVKKALKNCTSFLWTVFTRFEPAADIHCRSQQVHRHHICYGGPILIDARMKDSYPPEVFCDPVTAKKVTERWREYFPDGQEMGDSDEGHV